MKPFREYRVGALAHEVVLAVYRETANFPREELFGLTSQMRRSAASVPANIAEGSARGDREFHQFLRIALGSAAELEYHLLLAHDLGYLTDERHEYLDSEVGKVKRMLVTFMRRLEKPDPAEPGQRPTADGQRRSATK